MAGADNLKGKGFDSRTAEEQREIARKGGAASGKARRRKKALKSVLNQILATPLPDEAAAKLGSAGIDPEDANYQAAVGAALVKKAMAGNVNAISLLAQLTADDPYVQARQAEVRIKRDELKEKQREYDLDREDRRAESAGEDDIAAAWLDAVIATDNEQEASDEPDS